MNDATTTQPRAADNTMQPRPEGERLGYGKSIGGNLPRGIERTAQLAYCRDVIQVLKRKRDRYKGRWKVMQAATVQACTDELRGVWK